MEATKITIESVKLFDNKEIADVQLTFTEPIRGFAYNDAKERVEQDVTHVSLTRSQLTRELCSANDLIDEYRGCQSTAFTQKQLSLILRGAVLTIAREYKAAGEPILNADGEPVVDADGNALAYKNDCYITTILKAKLTDRATQRLEDALTL